LKTDSLTYAQITRDWDGLVNLLKIDSISCWMGDGGLWLEMGVSSKSKIKEIVAMGAI
jgi:hypothetical protein